MKDTTQTYRVGMKVFTRKIKPVGSTLTAHILRRTRAGSLEELRELARKYNRTPERTAIDTGIKTHGK